MRRPSRVRGRHALVSPHDKHSAPRQLAAACSSWHGGDKEMSPVEARLAEQGEQGKQGMYVIDTKCRRIQLLSLAPAQTLAGSETIRS